MTLTTHHSLSRLVTGAVCTLCSTPPCLTSCTTSSATPSCSPSSGSLPSLGSSTAPTGSGGWCLCPLYKMDVTRTLSCPSAVPLPLTLPLTLLLPLPLPLPLSLLSSLLYHLGETLLLLSPPPVPLPLALNSLCGAN